MSAHTPGTLRAASAIRGMVAAFGLTAWQLGELEKLMVEVIDRETAAPELLAALRPLVAIVNGGLRIHPLKREGYLEAARAAIAKAEGS